MSIKYSMLGDLIYEAEGVIEYIRVIELEPLKLEGSYIANGRLRNDNIIKEYCTFTSTYKDNYISYGEGKHLIISNNDNIRWYGRGFGRYINNKQIWRGSGIFNSTIEEFNNIVGVVEAEINGKDIKIKVLEWK